MSNEITLNNGESMASTRSCRIPKDKRLDKSEHKHMILFRILNIFNHENSNVFFFKKKSFCSYSQRERERECVYPSPCIIFTQ